MFNCNKQFITTPKYRTILLALLINLMAVKILYGPIKYARAIDDPLSRQKSHVYDIYGEYAVRGFKTHNASLRGMLNTGVKKITKLDDPALAWRKFIHDDDIIALKFTRVGSRQLRTNHDVAAALLQVLFKAGFKPENIMLVGLDDLPPEAADTIPCPYGWQNEKVDFGTNSDYLATWLDKVTAIINIPSVMDDNIFGLRCAMANLTWSLIKSPARLYMSKGDPFIPEVNNLPQIRDKVRLHIANNLRTLYYGGPEIKQKYVYEDGSFLFSTDPVALDRAALQHIRRQRNEQPMPSGVSEIIEAPYLRTAQALGLGYNDLSFIDYHHIKYDLVK